jgi:hypothetical protein
VVTLKLSIPPLHQHPVLTERGEGYEQLWHFHDVSEIGHRLDNLDLQPWQLALLWDGKEVELTDWQAWPHRVDPEIDRIPPPSKRH